MAQPKLRWGVVGTAKIADQLVRAWELSKTNELVAIASRDGAKAKAWAEKNHAGRVFDSYEKMLAADGIDAVYIPLPNSMHKEWTINAARNGKHVLCEKPLADNTQQVEEIIAARDSFKVTIMEAFMYRFHPKTLRAQKMITEGALGEVRQIRASFGFRLSDMNNIRNQKELTGGALMDVGCYCVNIARRIANAEPLAVQARAVWGDTDVDHSLAAVLEFPNDVLANIDCSFQIDTHQWYGVSGTRGHLGVTAPFRMGEDDQVLLYDHEGKHEDLIVRGANEYQMMIDHFADAVLNGKPLAYTLENSLGQARTIDALYQSARTGFRVTL